MEVWGKTLGIIGAGRIGQAVGRRAAGFGMSLLYASRSRKPAFERTCGAKKVALGALLRQSDIISIHCPLTPRTRHLIGRREFQSMKAGAILVNAARGLIVDEAALVRALRSGPLGAAGLDV
jgi:glyoxylate reductase